MNLHIDLQCIEEVFPLELKKLITKKKYEEVSEILHEKIHSGELKPGEKMDSVDQMAEQLQVSRSAVREALTALKAMGLIEIKQGSGTFVKEVTEKRLQLPFSTSILSNRETVLNLMELRKIIEVGTVLNASKKRTQQDIEYLKSILKKMEEVKSNDELGEKIDFEFHCAIAAASQNPFLKNLLVQISELMIETMRETIRISLFSKKTTSEKLYDEHMQIFLAIKQQNPDLAQLAMSSHLNNVENILIDYFESVDDSK